MELSDAEAGHDDVFESYESPRKKMKRHKGGSERIIIPRLNQVLYLLEDMCTFVKLLYVHPIYWMCKAHAGRFL